MTVQIVERAQITPGKCFISGDFNGPFIDTGVDIRGRGRVYLALKHFAPVLRDAGWVHEDEVADDIARAEELTDTATELVEKAALADTFIETIAPLLPAPEPIVKQVPVKDRAVVRERDRLLEVVAQLEEAVAQRDGKIRLMAEAQANAEAPPTSETEGSGDSEAGEAVTVEVAGQEVNVDELLARSAKDVIAVAEGWDVTQRWVVAERERELAEAEGRKERVTVVRLGEPAEGGEDEEA